VAAVAERLGVPVVTVCRWVSDMCAEATPQQVVASAAGMGSTTLTVYAVQGIERLVQAMRVSA
jgi:hypothetical protein